MMHWVLFLLQSIAIKKLVTDKCFYLGRLFFANKYIMVPLDIVVPLNMMVPLNIVVPLNMMVPLNIFKHTTFLITANLTAASFFRNFL